MTLRIRKVGKLESAQTPHAVGLGLQHRVGSLLRAIDDGEHPFFNLHEHGLSLAAFNCCIRPRVVEAVEQPRLCCVAQLRVCCHSADAHVYEVEEDFLGLLGNGERLLGGREMMS